MVAFNPELQVAPTPDWTRESQGRGADRSLETLFAGVGDAVKSYAQTQDVLTRQEISQQASDAANQAAESPDMFQVDTPNTPQAIKDAVTQTQRLKQSYQQGAISDLDYLSRVDMRLKRLKSQYPGYRDIIDQEFSSAMGTSLANDIRRQQLYEQEQAASQGSEAAKDEREWRQANGKYLFRAFGDSLGRDKSFEEVQSAVYKLQAEEAQRDSDEKLMMTMEKNSARQKEMAKKNLMNQVSSGMDAAVRITIGGGKSVDMGAAIDLFMQDGKIDSNEREQLVIGFNAAERNALTTAQRMFTANLNPKSDGDYVSYAGILTDAKDREDVLSLIKERFAGYRQALFDNDAGLLKEYAKAADYRVDQQLAKVINGPNGDAYTTMAALKKLGVDLSLFAGTDAAADLADRTIQGLIELFPKRAAAGTGNDFATTLAQLEAQQITDPTAYRTLLNGMAAVITNPQMPDEAFANAAGTFFKDNNNQLLTKFAAPNAPDIFKKFVNPVVTKRIMASGDQELIEGYRQWAFKQFANVTRQGMNELKSWSPLLYKSLEFDGDKFVQVIQPSMKPFFDARGYDGNSKGLRTINEYLSNIKPLLESQGLTPGDFVQRMMGGTSWAGVEEPAGGIMDAVNKWLEGQQSAKDKGTPGAPNRAKAGDIEEAMQGHKEALNDIPNLSARSKFSQLIDNLEARGVPVEIAEGFRTQERQNELYAQGRTRPGPVVTWTRRSKHMNGRAIDIVPVALKNKPNWDPENPMWEIVGEEAAKLGLQWGISKIPGQKDKPHIQYNPTA